MKESDEDLGGLIERLRRFESRRTKITRDEITKLRMDLETLRRQIHIETVSRA